MFLDGPDATPRDAVRIVFDQETRPLRVGSQANVMVYSSNNAIMNAIGTIKMRLVALLTYVQ